MGTLKCVCVAREKDKPPVNIHQGTVGVLGLSGDIHYGTKHQISILPYERVKQYYSEKGEDVRYGSFGENLVVEGIDWTKAKVGDCYCCDDVILRITQLGLPSDIPEETASAQYPEMTKYYVFCKVVYEGILTEEEPFFEY